MKTQTLKSIFLCCMLHVTFCIYSNAQIVYTDVNPDQTFSANNSVYHLDLNNDGTTDYDITILTGLYFIYPYAKILLTPSPGNNVSVYSISNSYPLAFNYGALISSANTWAVNYSIIMAEDFWFYSGNWGHIGHWYHSVIGNWLNVTDKYLGLKFISGGNTYYGWARLNAHVYSNGTGNFTIKDYAYNSIANDSILAGQTCSPQAAIIANGPLSFCAGGSVVLTSQNSGNTLKYQWKKNNINITGATNKNYTAITAGDYKAKVTDTINNCYQTSGIITVTVPCIIIIDSYLRMTSSDELEHLSVFPNPATNSVTIKLPSDEAGEIQIVNLFGQIVYSGKINSEQTQIDLSKFSEGMYFVRWSSGENFETKTFSVVR